MKRAYVVYKKSAYQMINREPYKIKNLWKKNSKLAQHLKSSHHIHQQNLKKILKVLKKEKWDVVTEYRARVALVAQADLVVTVGGDGTLLEAAHHVRDVPVVSVNSDPKASVAFFSVCTANQFSRVLPKLGSKKYPLRHLPRLAIRVNGKLMGRPVLNDLLLAHRNPAATTRFFLKNNSKEFFYKSSGVWIATAAGSTAAICSAGGQKLPFLSKRWQYLVREPYGWQGRGRCGQILHRDSILKLKCGSNYSRLYFDGAHHSLPLEIGDKIEISQDSPRLNLYRCLAKN